MKISRIKSQLTGVPDYYRVSVSHWKKYEESGDLKSKSLALHYARVAEEMGQAIIEEDTTQEVLLESR